MIRLSRPPAPDVLATNSAAWTERFLAKRAEHAGKRPPKAQYGHRQVIDALSSMSHGKCFYCESLLSEAEVEVDHYVEVAEAPHLAFEWTNLYMSCGECNGGKLPNKTAPCSACLDPCDPSAEPAEHLAFEGDLVRAHGDSETGRSTIGKYRLNRESLMLRRARRLHSFMRATDAIQKAMISEGRTQKTAGELELLRSFRQREQPFSLLFRLLEDMP